MKGQWLPAFAVAAVGSNDWQLLTNVKGLKAFKSIVQLKLVKRYMPSPWSGGTSNWALLSSIPIGIFASTLAILIMQQQLALALVNERATISISSGAYGEDDDHGALVDLNAQPTVVETPPVLIGATGCA